MPRAALERLRERLVSTVLGSEDAADLLLTALLARGHALIEGAPGIGKTSLAHTLATSIGGTFKRVQFTPDLLPADLLGYSLYRMDRGDFEFVPGPVFAHCVLADEINRTSPRVQSALLECMNEQQVTLDGITRPLPAPFFVIATQNDSDRHGTFPLPEPQLDRFLLSIRMDLPTADVQQRILLAHAAGEIQSGPKDATLLDPAAVLLLQNAVQEVQVAPVLAGYITALCESLRRLSGSDHAVSVRGSLALMQASRAAAYLDGAPALYPDHIQALFPAVLRHRLSPDDGRDPAELITAALESTPVP
ncbi:MAG: AAA family ATPase [Verrucomicrobia bacterium]|nr:MAG: AAA family ATPase [Verrucomicrobiota bacterium]TAE88344.1 MAG: AAA family ATPase [Verrucomicrobiota bacterium]TAF26798.1 MAG: AAA family ATPase [Verrucomicrobiota bacterium]TAF42055.1 MAG: AAA family ATPase [Verrucomicrobiota bacterium]